MEDASRHTFIVFSQQLLEKMSIKDAIFHLQHESGFNINLILYLLWVANAQHGRLSKQQIKQLKTHIAMWDQRVIAELKYTHALVENHSDPEAVKLKHMLEEEIAKAFVIEQHMIDEMNIKNAYTPRNATQQLADACTSIAHYCELRNELLVEADRDAFVQLLNVTFPQLDQSEIERQVHGVFNRFDREAPQPAQQVLW